MCRVGRASPPAGPCRHRGSGCVSVCRPRPAPAPPRAASAHHTAAAAANDTDGGRLTRRSRRARPVGSPVPPAPRGASGGLTHRRRLCFRSHRRRRCRDGGQWIPICPPRRRRRRRRRRRPLYRRGGGTAATERLGSGSRRRRRQCRRRQRRRRLPPRPFGGRRGAVAESASPPFPPPPPPRAGGGPDGGGGCGAPHRCVGPPSRDGCHPGGCWPTSPPPPPPWQFPPLVRADQCVGAQGQQPASGVSAPPPWPPRPRPRHQRHQTAWVAPARQTVAAGAPEPPLAIDSWRRRLAAAVGGGGWRQLWAAAASPPVPRSQQRNRLWLRGETAAIGGATGCGIGGGSGGGGGLRHQRCPLQWTYLGGACATSAAAVSQSGRGARRRQTASSAGQQWSTPGATMPQPTLPLPPRHGANPP